MSSFTGTDRFRIVRRLGSGGMGVVYEAYDRKREQRVALKTLFFEDPEAIYRLKHEFRTLADVAHRNLITFYELIREGDTWFITMELVEGETFLDYVRPWNPKESSEKLDLTRLRAALPQLVEGVHHLHESGRWHRDLKPGNVLVTKEGRVVLLDFGISAQIQSEGPATVATGAVGTVAYMAPEQVDQGRSAPASDWYAVGVMLYEALTGHLPFSGPLLNVLESKLKDTPVHPDQHAANLPADLTSLCLDLMAREASGRPAGLDILVRLGRSGPAWSVLSQTPPPGTTIKGREQHLAVLEGAFQKARSGRSVSVHVHGVSGIGKTYLVEHFLLRLDPDVGTVVLTGRCYPRESMPYKAVDGVIDSLTRYLRSLTEEQVLRYLPRDILYLARVFPVLMQVSRDLDFIFPSPDVPDAQEIRKRAFSALRRLLGSIGAEHPLVLVIDDLQWADVDSIALLDDLTRPDRAPPLLLVCCFRGIGDEVPPFLQNLLGRAGEESCVDLPVGPLSDVDAEELVRLRIGTPEVRPVIRSIVREAAGSPFVLEQLVRHILECDKSEMTNASLAVMLDARINRCPPGTRGLLETLSVAERPVDFEVAHLAAGIEGDARALVGTLEVAHLIRTSATADLIETYHDRLRECIAEQLSAEKVVTIHLRLAQAIRSMGLDDPEALFVHYLKAGRTTQAAEQAVKSGHNSMKALAFDRAARHFREAIRLAAPEDRAKQELKVHLAQALADAGRPAEAADAYLEASAGREPAVALECKVRAAEQLLFGGHSDRGLLVTRDLLGSAGLKMASNRKRAVLGILARRTWLRIRGLDFVPRRPEEVPATDLLRIDISWGVSIGLLLVDTIIAYEFSTRFLLMTLKAGEATRISRGLSLLSGFLSTGGGKTRRRTDQLIAEAEKLAQSVGSPREIGLAGLSAGAAALLRGEYRRAAALLLDAEKVLLEECTGVMWERTTCQTFLLSCFIYLGNLREVSRRLPRMVSDALERGNLLAATEARTRSNFGWLAQGQVERAQKELELALATWSHRGFHRQHYNALISQANIHLYRGEAAAAWELVEELWTPLRKSLLLRVQVLRAESNFLRARCALAAAAAGDDQRRLLRIAARHATALAREEMPWIDPFADLLRAAVRHQQGDREMARLLLLSAVERFERVDLSLYAAAARRRLGEIVGGEEGERLVTASTRMMWEQLIPEPDRVAEVLAPGFPHAG